MDVASGSLLASELPAVLGACARLRHSPTAAEEVALAAQLREAVDSFPSSQSWLIDLGHALAALHRGRGQAQTSPLVSAFAKAAAGHTTKLEPARLMQIVTAFAQLGFSSTGPRQTPVFALAAQALCRNPGDLKPKDMSLALNALARSSYKDDGSLMRSVLLHIKEETLHDWAAFDLALLCNAALRLGVSSSRSSDMAHEWSGLLGRLAGLMRTLGPQCTPQDVAHFAAAFASLQPHCHQVARAAICDLCTFGQISNHIKMMPLEGMCAVLGACARLRALDSVTAPAFGAAIERVHRIGFQLTPSHLGHLAFAFMRWLPRAHTSESTCQTSPIAVVEGLGSTEVLTFFRATLAPHVTRMAHAFTDPRHVAFTALALGHAGSPTEEDMTPLRALAQRLLEAQQAAVDPLRWESFPGQALVVLCEAFTAVHYSTGRYFSPGVDARDHAIASMLESLTWHLLGRTEGCESHALENTAPSRIFALDMSSTCRLAGLFSWTPIGVEVCRAAAARALSQPVGALSARDVAQLLDALCQLELRDGKTCGDLLWRLHYWLWSHRSDSGPNSGHRSALADHAWEAWDLRSATTVIVALDKLGCLRALAGCEAGMASFTCVLWGLLQLLRSLLGAHASASCVAAPAQVRQLTALLRSCMHVMEELPLPPCWGRSLGEHLAGTCAVIQAEVCASLNARDWSGFVGAAAELASISDLREEHSAALRVHLYGIVAVGFHGHMTAGQAAAALASFAAVGGDACIPPSLGKALENVAALGTPDAMMVLHALAACTAFADEAWQITASNLCKALATRTSRELWRPRESFDLALCAVFVLVQTWNTAECAELARHGALLLEVALARAAASGWDDAASGIGCDLDSASFARLGLALLSVRFGLGFAVHEQQLSLRAVRAVALLVSPFTSCRWLIQAGHQSFAECLQSEVAECLQAVGALGVTIIAPDAGATDYAHEFLQ